MNKDDLLQFLKEERLSDLEMDVYSMHLDIFIEKLPNSLYLSPYELEKTFGGNQAVWRKLFQFKGIKRAIEIEIATITEYAARKALNQLASGAGNLTAADISAIKSLLDQASTLKASTVQKEKVIVHYIPPREESAS
jgi:hypothetical protein